jgi:hypothetical protein
MFRVVQKLVSTLPKDDKPSGPVIRGEILNQLSFSKRMLLHSVTDFCYPTLEENVDSRLHFVETVHVAACTSGRIPRCLISRIDTAAIQCFCCKYKTSPRRFQSITCCLLCCTHAHAGWKRGAFSLWQSPVRD